MLDDSHSRHRDDQMDVLWSDPAKTRDIVQAMLFGKHIDPYLSEMFHFMETFQEAWERFFSHLGYRLNRKEFGATPFYYLSPRSDDVRMEKLSQGSTFLGLFLARHFFMQGLGSGNRVSAEEVFRLLVATYTYARLRPVFFKSAGPTNSMELSEDQAEKFKAQIKSELGRLARYRFVDLAPGPRAPFTELVVHRLPALHRFWELALQLSEARDGQPDLSTIVSAYWGDAGDEGDGGDVGDADQDDGLGSEEEN